MTPIAVPPALLERAYAHARRCFPAECCGYFVGQDNASVDAIVECRNAQVDGEHPTEPDRDADTGYVIAGAELIAYARSFGTPRPARSVYHSHTNGRAYFSKVDHDVAAPAFGGDPASPAYPVQHVVIGTTADRITEAAQFAWSDNAATFIEIARWLVGVAP